MQNAPLQTERFVIVELMHNTSLKTAVQATLHCLTGCGIGEVLGMVISSAANWNNTVTIVVSVILSFFFGYLLSLLPLLKAGLSPVAALQTALAADTVSITTMEVTDNLLEVVIPGALAATLSTFLFWWSLALSLAVAFVVTVPVNYWLIKRGKGHAVMHDHH
jgi:putative flippase GtrA